MGLGHPPHCVARQMVKNLGPMRVADLREEWVDGWKRAVATVIWERNARPPQEIYFATDEANAELLKASPNAFLVACAQAATTHFEKRIHIEGEVCPHLYSGLREALAVKYGWYRDAHPVQLEANLSKYPFQAQKNGIVASMFSGGIDALATLRANREAHPVGSADSIGLGIVMASGWDGFEILPGTWPWQHLDAMASDAELPLMPMRTNIRDLDPSDHFFGNHLYGALLAAVGHSVAPAVKRVLIAGADIGIGGDPDASDPALDPLYSSGDLEIIHDNPRDERYDKTALVAEWPVTASHLKVCLFSNRLPEGQLNCGRCEKCYRTMLPLLAFGMLRDFPAFEPNDITAADIDRDLEIGRHVAFYYPRIISELRNCGRTALADSVQAKFDVFAAAKPGPGERFKNFERDYLNGAIRRLRNRFLRRWVT